MPKVSHEDELDRLIRWALYSLVANARPSPAVWHNVHRQLFLSPTGAAIQERRGRPPGWQRPARVAWNWTISALGYVFDPGWDERFARQRNSRCWRDYLALATPFSVMIMTMC
jgi:NADH:ubiquinone oxidoreductase subunit